MSALSLITSRNEEFWSLPAQFQVTSLQPSGDQQKQFSQKLGSLSQLLITYPIIDEPAGTTGYDKLFNVSCLTDEEIWTSGDTGTMKLLNLQGEVLKSVQTISKNSPQDIAVTRNEGLVYADSVDSSINLVHDTQISHSSKREEINPKDTDIDNTTVHGTTRYV